MNLIEEKKMVCEKLMNWKLEKGVSTKYWILKDNKVKPIKMKNWNPQENRKCWDEIWDKLKDKKIINEYNKNIHMLIKKQKLNDMELFWFLHTLKPEICWEILIKTLKGVFN